MDLILDNIDGYISFLVDALKPRKTLMLAIDGVAPRAKLNQQRARRYRSAKGRAEFEEVIRTKKEQFQDWNIPCDGVKEKRWDTNRISPGTTFMRQVGNFFHAMAQKKIRSGEWAKLEVIVSDCFEQGEGEHKIMQYLRSSAPKDGCHAVFGLDADLIFLTLLREQPQMRVIRDNTGRELEFDFRDPLA